MKRKITILGAGMMGSALAFPAAENGNEVHIVGTCLDDDIIDGYIKTRKHEIGWDHLFLLMAAVALLGAILVSTLWNIREDGYIHEEA